MGNSPSRDLDGLLVISLEQAVAAPYAASRLADAGARVIKCNDGRDAKAAPSFRERGQRHSCERIRFE